MKSFVLMLLLGLLMSVAATDYTEVTQGCMTFFGKVECGSGVPTREDATVVLWEWDPFFDDRITETNIQKGFFKFHACFPDYPGWTREVYIMFHNVCEAGEKKKSGILNLDAWTHYVIHKDDVTATKN